MSTDFKNKMLEASELAKDAPAQYRDIAFKVILEYLLYSHDETKKVTRPVLYAKVTQKQVGGIDAILNSDFDWTSTHIPKFRPIEQNLYILKIAMDKFGIDWLSPQDIQIILSQKFRLTKSANAVSMSLMSAVGKYVDRRQEGKEFVYKITFIGKAFLDDVIKNRMEDQK